MKAFSICVGTLAFASIFFGIAHAPSRAETPSDPYETQNRTWFASHQKLYRHVIRPVSVFYNRAVPHPARDGIHNFLVNIDLPVTFANDVLQIELVRSGETLARFVVNSTIGLGGLIDVAHDMGIPAHETDFGDTLAAYGVGEGPYLFVPLLGPSNPRELAGRVVDIVFDPLTYVTYGASTLVSVGRDGTTYLDKKSRTIAVTDTIDRMSPDPYATTRSLYQKHLEAEAEHVDTDPDFDEHPANARLAIQDAQEASLTLAPPGIQSYCTTVADARVADAAANSSDDDVQEAVRDGTFRNCIAWQMSHREDG